MRVAALVRPQVVSPKSGELKLKKNPLVHGRSPADSGVGTVSVPTTVTCAQPEKFFNPGLTILSAKAPSVFSDRASARQSFVKQLAV
jgi:hypothetical protein